MQQLNSKNYQQVEVTIRGDEKPIVLKTAQGDKLMDFLTSEQKSSHVKLNDVDGTTQVIRVYDIAKVQPIYDVEPMNDTINRLVKEGKI